METGRRNRNEKSLWKGGGRRSWKTREGFGMAEMNSQAKEMAEVQDCGCLDWHPELGEEGYYWGSRTRTGNLRGLIWLPNRENLLQWEPVKDCTWRH